MKKILLYVGIALAAIGCAKDPDITASGDNMLTIASSINTRVVNEQWEVSDEIGVYMTSSTFGDLGANVLYTTTGSSGDFSSTTPLYYPSSGEVDIFAYYPWVDGVSLTVYPIDSEAQVDLLSATKSEVTSSSAAVVMSFNHLLSKVSLTIKEGDGLEESDLAGLEVRLSGISTTTDFNLEDPTASNLTNAGGELTLTTAEDGTSSSVIVIPQSLNGATLLFATKDYGAFSATLSTEKFEVGKEYKYTATLNRDGVELSEANIDLWDENADSGTADIVDIELKSNGTYYINSAKGLAAFSDLVYGAGSNTKNATFAGFEQSAFESDHTDIDGVLTRDIDLSDICYAGANWNPIGRNLSGISYHYGGTFDGGGHKISNLYINATSQQALFGWVAEGGVVCNLGVSGEVTGCADGEASQTAGIAANNYGNIFNCYSEVNVTGDTNVGSIVGYNYYTGKVVNCHNHGNIHGTKNNVGGIVGQNGSTGYVGYCYSVGYVTLDNTTDPRIGGVVGYNITVDESDPLIKGSFCLNTTTYSIGQVGENASSGGITGNVCEEQYLKSEVFATIINNGAWTYNDTYDPTSVYTTACAWVYNDGGYPLLLFYDTPLYDSTVYDIIYNSGTYQIYTGLGLKVFANLVNGSGMPNEGEVTSGGDAYFKNITTAQATIKGTLMSDIDLEDAKWTPIGNSSNVYNGTFDGDGYLVEGLYVSGSSNAGLFSCTGSSAEISNLGVSGNVSGYEIVGGVVGWNDGGTLTNCYNTGNVSSDEYVVGGVVGWNDGGTLTNCYNTGNVSCDTESGGVVGWNYGGTLTNCYNTGNVSRGNTTGGVVAYNRGGTLTNCYNTGDVSDAYEAGGVIGHNTGTLTNSYNTGSVSGTYIAGGVVGNNNTGTLTNSYNTGSVSGNIYVGGVAGSNNSTLTNCYWNSTVYGGDGIGIDNTSSTTTPMSTTEMQSSDFVTTLTNNAALYNSSIGATDTQACSWIQTSVDSSYPILNFGIYPLATNINK